MADKNIQIKKYNGTTWDVLYPKTKAEIVITAGGSNVEAVLAGKVDKIVGKALSTNDFTSTYKTALDDLSTNLGGKVDKIAGKALSTNDFTNLDKTKLDGLTDVTVSATTPTDTDGLWFEELV